MRAAEKNLLLAVRNRLRAVIGYSDSECNIEIDELAPGTVGDRYIVVVPAGYTPGPRHRTSGGVHDLVYGLDVIVVKRIRHVPRDRRRDTFLGNLDGLDDELDQIHTVIDWSYQVINDANQLIQNETGSTEGFVEPLRFVSIDRRPRLVSPDVFAASGTQAAGMARTISFHGARRISTVQR